MYQAPIEIERSWVSNTATATTRCRLMADRSLEPWLSEGQNYDLLIEQRVKIVPWLETAGLRTDTLARAGWLAECACVLVQGT